jgi:hypothetical protein
MFGSSGNHGKSDRRVKFGPEFNAVMVIKTPDSGKSDSEYCQYKRVFRSASSQSSLECFLHCIDATLNAAPSPFKDTRLRAT